MKRYLCYFATMLLVLAITNLCLGGELFRTGVQSPDELSARSAEVSNPGNKLKGQKEIEEDDINKLGMLIASKSCEFVQSAFSMDKAGVARMLSEDAEYIVSEDKSSYLRYTTQDLHVEGYMATDKKLVQVRQSWYVIEDDGTITSEVEVFIEGEAAPQIWYIHYRRSFGQWKIFMLENGM